MSASPLQAIEYLQSRSWTAPQAIDALDSLSASVEILHLFKHYFPREFKSFNPMKADAFPSFLILVNKRLFPVSECAIYEWREWAPYSSIPLESLTDDWWDYEVESLNDFTRTVLEALGIVTNPVGYPELDSISRRFVDYKKLARLSQGPLKHLPDAIRVLFHETGNGWIDAGQEEIGYHSYSWNVADIDRLAAVWKDAKPILERSWKINRYVQHHPERIEQVRELLVRAAVKPKKAAAPDPEKALLVRVLV